MERMCLRFFRKTVSHSFEPAPEQSNPHKQMQKKPVPALQQWVELLWNAWTLGRLPNRRSAVPTCALHWSMSTISDFCQRLNLLQGMLGMSATRLPVVANPSLPSSHTRAHALFTQRHGGRTPFSQRKQRWDTGKKSSRDMQTRVSVWAQTLAEVGLFLEQWGIHPMNLHNWNSTHVSTSNQISLAAQRRF